MPSKKKRLPVYLTDEEHVGIAASAERAGLSLSTFCKRVSLGYQVPGLERYKLRTELRRVRADLGRLGGLFKLALSEGKGSPHEIRRLLWEIEERQREVQETILQVR